MNGLLESSRYYVIYQDKERQKLSYLTRVISHLW